MATTEQARHFISRYLKESRLKANLDPADASRHLNLEPEQLLRLESGLEAVSLGQLYAIANVYNIPTDEIISLVLQLTSALPEQIGVEDLLIAGQKK